MTQMLPYNYLIVFINTYLAIIGIIKVTSLPHDSRFFIRKTYLLFVLYLFARIQLLLPFL